MNHPMRRLLAFYEKNRNNAYAHKDGERYLYWSALCTEVIRLIENMES